MLVIAATMRQPITSSGSIRPARSAGSHRRSNANCGGAPPSNQSSVISRPSIAWGRNYLAHHAGDAVNAVLAAAGYNFHLLLKWLELLLYRFLAAQKAAAALQ